MRLAINSKIINDKLACRLAALPDPIGFPVSAIFIKNGTSYKFQGILIEDFASSMNPRVLSDVGAITSNIATLMETDVLKGEFTPALFAKVIEERHGRQVVEHNGKITSISRLKGKDEDGKEVHGYRPLIGGKPLVHADVVVEAETDKEAASKMKLRFINAAAENDELATSITAWLKGGCKVQVIKSEKVDFIDLHSFK
jgi:hypothetical protein